MNREKKNIGGISLSAGCSNNCLFCGSAKKVPAATIKKQEWLAYKSLLEFKQEGLKRISISGSDPIEYNKIIELIQYIRKEGFEDIHLGTHGTRLSNPLFLNKLISSGITAIRLPVYGSNPKIHDACTRTPGSFSKLMTGIKNLLKKDHKIQISISCVVLEPNKNDLLNMFNLINKLGIKSLSFTTPCLSIDEYFFYIPFKDLGLYVKKLYNYALKINDGTMFLEIPFCVFSELNLKNINNTGLPPKLGKYNQPAEHLKTSIPDIPSYRLKKKVAMCNSCRAFNYCDGFFVNDIDRFGTGKLQPIK